MITRKHPELGGGPSLAGAIALTGLFATSLHGSTTTVDFAGGAPSNIGNWTWGIPVSYPATGGNPGRYMRTDNLDTFAPQLRTQGSSIFTGDYRAAGVISIGVDVRTIAVDFSAAGRPLALMLIDDNGTPGNPNDDWAAYTLGADIPTPSEGWKSIDFVVPSNATTLPPGWNTITFGPGANPNWSAVITGVDRLQFFYGDPEFFFIFQMWDLGADNIRITVSDPAVPGDLDGDGIVDGEDLGVLLSLWGSDDPLADLNGDGIVDGEDLGILLSNWT